MSKISVAVAGYFLDLLFPIRCLGCGKNREDLPARQRWICPDCLEKIAPREEQICPDCKEFSEGGKTHGLCRSGFYLDGLWSAAIYDELLKKAVHDFKFKFIKDLSYPLSELMIKSVLEAEEYGEFHDLMLISYAKEEEEGIYADEKKNSKAETYLVPVPLHRKRKAERGFNQSALIATLVGQRFCVPVREDMLMRIRNTRPQSKTKSREERQENIERAFLCPMPEEIKSRNIILVDDICTTSATLNECAKELKRYGAKSVWGLVAARK